MSQGSKRCSKCSISGPTNLPLSLSNISALQVRASQQSITTDLWLLTTYIYDVVIVTGGFCKKSLWLFFRSSCMQMFFKTSLIRNFTIFTGKSYGLQLYFNLVPKETSTQAFSCQYCKIITNNFFHRTPPVAAFVSLIK